MYTYRAVGNRCAVDFEALALPIENAEALALLARKGFEIVPVDLMDLACRCVETSTYRRGARLSEAPEVVDCSSFVKWLYGQRGIWLPRRSIQQRDMSIPVAYQDIRAGDLVFCSGRIDYYLTDPENGVGYVGIATGEGTVVHAASYTVGVTENSLAAFTAGGGFRGARRIIPQSREVITLFTPPEREVEMSDDIRWIVLQSIPTVPARHRHKNIEVSSVR